MAARNCIVEAANLGLPEPAMEDTTPPRSAQMAHVLYMAAYLPRLRGVDEATLKAIMQQCSEHSQREPLHLMRGEQFAVPAFSGELLTGNQVMSLLVCGLWVFCGEDTLAAHPLLASWPALQEALVLAPRR